MTKKIHPRTPIAVYPLDLQGVREGIRPGWVGHMQMSEEEGMPMWNPYRVGEKLDFEPTKRTKFIVAGYCGLDAVKDELKKPEGLVFLLADGMFPVGCYIRDICTVMAVKPGEVDPAKIAEQIDQDIGTNLKARATGKIQLNENCLYITDFSTAFFKELKNYEAVIAAVVRSEIAPKGTTIKFQAKI